MKDFYYLIIGGGIAGTTAAENIRFIDAKNSIAIISDEPYPLYSRVALSKPNFFLQKLPPETVWLKKPEWYKARNVVLTRDEAIAIDVKRKILRLKSDGEVRYQKLLIASGAKPRTWQAPLKTEFLRGQVAGAKLAGVFRMQTLDDAVGIMERIKRVKRAVVVGGGFIAFEMCDMLCQRGLEVYSAIRENYFWNRILDDETAGMIEYAMAENGVKIIKNSEIVSVNGTDEIESVTFASGENLPCEMAIIGTGVEPAISWLTSGLKTARGVLVNEYLETSEPNIWAAGDAAEYLDIFSGKNILAGNWANAQMQGMTAGKNMAGQKIMFNAISPYTTQGFGIHLAFIGDISKDGARESIKRNLRRPNSYTELIIKNKKLSGAILVNHAQELKTISALIRQRLDTVEIRSELQNPDFELKKLIKF